MPIVPDENQDRRPLTSIPGPSHICRDSESWSCSAILLLSEPSTFLSSLEEYCTVLVDVCNSLLSYQIATDSSISVTESLWKAASSSFPYHLAQFTCWPPSFVWHSRIA